VVVHDLFGGDILKTSLPDYDVDHFYNRIDGVVVDLPGGSFRHRSVMMMNRQAVETPWNVLRLVNMKYCAQRCWPI
jgi:hypothetical protein